MPRRVYCDRAFFLPSPGQLFLYQSIQLFISLSSAAPSIQIHTQSTSIHPSICPTMARVSWRRWLHRYTPLKLLLPTDQANRTQVDRRKSTPQAARRQGCDAAVYCSYPSFLADLLISSSRPQVRTSCRRCQEAPQIPPWNRCSP